MRHIIIWASLFCLSAQMGTAQEIVTKQYDDGSVYEGTFVNGRRITSGPPSMLFRWCCGVVV